MSVSPVFALTAADVVARLIAAPLMPVVWADDVSTCGLYGDVNAAASVDADYSYYLENECVYVTDERTGACSMFTVEYLTEAALRSELI